LATEVVLEDPGKEGERENTRVKTNREERRKQEEGKRGKKGKDNAEAWRTRSIAGGEASGERKRRIGEGQPILRRGDRG